jgi:hypothetical protein
MESMDEIADGNRDERRREETGSTAGGVWVDKVWAR